MSKRSSGKVIPTAQVLSVMPFDDEEDEYGNHHSDYQVKETGTKDKRHISHKKAGSSEFSDHSKPALVPSPSMNNIKTWPNALRQDVIKSFSRPANELSANRFFDRYDWPIGLRQTVYKSCKKVAFRFFIVDDSGEHLFIQFDRILID
jgi:hypothetical protein